MAPDIQYEIFIETDPASLELDIAQRQLRGSTAGFHRSIPMETSVIGCIERIAECLAPVGETFFFCVDSWNYILRTVSAGGELRVVAQLGIDRHRDRTAAADATRIGKIYFVIDLVAQSHLIEEITHRLDEGLRPVQLSIITWWYKQSRGDFRQRECLMEEPVMVRDAFYPWIEGGVESYLNRYLESGSSILFIEGVPGTGKTSLLRWLLWRSKMHAYLTYDDEVLSKDEMFVSFLFSDAHILIVEDADAMLTSRENAGNKLVSRFLGASDGIVKLPNKKIVFTTNISDLSKVDAALLRPGRCFDVLHCRPLHHREAVRAAQAAEIAAPREDRDYTLAELFNPTSGGKHALRKAGF